MSSSTSSAKRERSSSLREAVPTITQRRRCEGVCVPPLLTSRCPVAAEEPSSASSTASWVSSDATDLSSDARSHKLCSSSSSSKDVEEEEEEDSCFICMGDFSPRHRKTPIPCANKCSQHTVHARCIYEWQESRAQQNPTQQLGSCPLCRGPLAALDYIPRDKIGSHKLRVDAAARRLFISRPLPRRAGTVRCYVRALRRAPAAAPHRYELWLQAPTTLAYPLGPLPALRSPAKGDVLLAVAQRRPAQWSYSQLDIATEASDGAVVDLHSPQYLACVYSSLQGLEHTLVAPCEPGQRFFAADDGNGRRDATLTTPGHAGNVCELAAVRYTQARVDGNVAPRRIHVCLPVPSRLSETDGDRESVTERAANAQQAVQTDAAVVPAGVRFSELSMKRAGEDDDDDDGDVDFEHSTVTSQPQERLPQTSPSTRDSNNKYLSRWVSSAHRPGSDNELLSSRLAARAADSAAHAAAENGRFVFGENRAPNWIDAIQAFSLDFSGRVTMPSNRNFQLLLGDERHLAMQFGKVADAADAELFTLDCAHPLSPLQAFGVALSACDRNLVSC